MSHCGLICTPLMTKHLYVGLWDSSVSIHLFRQYLFFFFSLLEYLMGNALLTQSLHFKDEEESHHQRGYVTCLTLLSSSTAGLRTHTQLCRWLSSLQCTEKKNKPQSNWERFLFLLNSKYKVPPFLRKKVSSMALDLFWELFKGLQVKHGRLKIYLYQVL